MEIIERGVSSESKARPRLVADKIVKDSSLEGCKHAPVPMLRSQIQRIGSQASHSDLLSQIQAVAEDEHEEKMIS